MNTLNVGVIGLGEIGQAHCDALSHIERANLVAVADVDETVLEDTAKKYGATPYSDYEAMMEHDDLQAVVIATPDAIHKDPCLSAAAAGKHILVEKPIAMTVEESEEIIQAAEAANVKLMVGFTVRYFSQYIHAKDAVARGDLGDVISVFARRTNLITQPDRVNGRTGVMFFLGVHDFDAMRWIVGSEPVSVYCESANAVDSKYPIENETFSIIRFTNGAIGCAHIGWYLPANHPAGFDFKLDVTGSQGILSLDMMKQGIELHTTSGSRYPFMAAPLIAEDKDFVDAVLDDGPSPVSGHDGLVAVRMVLGALESIESNQPVKL
ncbi:MAG: gfo/Idh/MocA family oxidoreductase [Chloroflexi bacterium]|nr:MAG: gfo/Idh/MocA family oxidoreductase [Chloroflexota bacterium]MBL1192972.1 gfo/Idh/MocA family oxidoreductase [Chloroflexota bacterium]NOH10264.1 Gfo/Idh/MocA family oxidoreductase [Chloroflexota bacterium]